jgi:hypothetical protein
MGSISVVAGIPRGPADHRATTSGPCLREPADQLRDLGVHRRQGGCHRGTGHVGHLPKFHALDPPEKAVQQQRAMLGFIQGIDASGPRKIGLVDLPRKPHLSSERHTALLESRQRLRRDRAPVLGPEVEREPARLRPPGEIRSRHLPIEQEFREATSVVIPATHKQKQRG